MNLSEAIKSINAAVVSPGNPSEEERREALSACERLRASLETPVELVMRLCFSTQDVIALRLGVDMKLFDTAVKASSDGGEVRIEELFSGAKADPLLVTRIMRLLVGIGVFKESGKGLFTLTHLAGAFVSDSTPTASLIQFTQMLRAVSGLPDYFDDKGYKNPDDAYDGPFQYSRATKLHLFEYLASKPKLQQAYSNTMKMTSPRRGLEWLDIFPVEIKLHVESSSDPLLIDIGGGLGHDLIAFKQKYPTIPGQLILQDLSFVIDLVKDLPSGIDAMEHDFFAPQPVKGAKAYYMHSVLHDWPDKQSRQILSNIKDAMGPESLLLICETVQPETGVSVDSAHVDMIMMAQYAALERTQQHFETLLDEVGLELVRVWRTPPLTFGPEQRGEQAALIEATLKNQ